MSNKKTYNRHFHKIVLPEIKKMKAENSRKNYIQKNNFAWVRQKYQIEFCKIQLSSHLYKTESQQRYKKQF